MASWAALISVAEYWLGWRVAWLGLVAAVARGRFLLELLCFERNLIQTIDQLYKEC